MHLTLQLVTQSLAIQQHPGKTSLAKEVDVQYDGGNGQQDTASQQINIHKYKEILNSGKHLKPQKEMNTKVRTNWINNWIR
jgi:hypothetical protein